jgi:hypothetical protein
VKTLLIGKEVYVAARGSDMPQDSACLHPGEWFTLKHFFLMKKALALRSSPSNEAGNKLLKRHQKSIKTKL